MVHKTLQVGLLAIMFLLLCRALPQTTKNTLSWKPFSFSGYEWKAKKTDRGRRGPGPNLYSYNQNNVWVDEEGKLHLQITHKKSRWWCAEVAGVASLGYGTYRFHVEKLPGDLDDQVVLGLFTWDDASLENHREIDIEISSWGSSSEENTQFVVQPHHREGNKHRLDTPLSESDLVYSFEWADTSIVFRVEKDLPDPPGKNNIIYSWSYTGVNNPKPGQESPRIALWLYQGKPPKHRQEVAVVISRFEFIPEEI